jgi:hypothetical protein
MFCYIFLYAPIAQLVEQLPLKETVPGSSPGRRTFKDVWGIPNMMVLTITTNATHMKNMMAYLQKLDPTLSERFLFKALPTFGSNWRVPPVLTDILEPWQRADGSVFDIDKA